MGVLAVEHRVSDVTRGRLDVVLLGRKDDLRDMAESIVFKLRSRGRKLNLMRTRSGFLCGPKQNLSDEVPASSWRSLRERSRRRCSAWRTGGDHCRSCRKVRTSSMAHQEARKAGAQRPS